MENGNRKNSTGVKDEANEKKSSGLDACAGGKSVEKKHPAKILEARVLVPFNDLVCDLGSLSFSGPQFPHLQSEGTGAVDVQIFGLNAISGNNLSFGESATSPRPTLFNHKETQT